MWSRLRDYLHIRHVDWVLVGILVVGLGLRLYRMREMSQFDYDQEYAVNFAWRVWNEYPIQLVGQGLSVMGLFMGPWFFYMMTPFVWLAGFDPVGGVVGSILLGGVTMVAYYWVAKEMWGRKAGLIAAWLKAIVLLELEHDWSVAPSYGAELTVVLMWYWMYKHWVGDKPGWFWLGLLLGMFTSLHPIMFMFYPVVLVFLVWARQWPGWKQIGLLVVGGILPVTTWLLFEYFRNWQQIIQLWGMFTDGESSGTVSSQSRWPMMWRVVGERIQDVWGMKELPMWLVVLGFALLLLVVNWKVWKQKFHGIFFPLSVAMGVMYYVWFPSHVPEYYLHGSAVLILIYAAGMLGSLKFRHAGFLVLGWMVWIGLVNVRALQSRYWNNGDLVALGHKQAVMAEILRMQPVDKPFYVSYITEPGKGWGFEYLWKIEERKPAPLAEGNDVYTIVIPWRMSADSINDRFGGIGLIYPDRIRDGER